MIANPTHSTYAGLTAAFEFFNAELFAGQLPHCLITMQRHKGAYGYFSGDRFAHIDDPKQITDEIALNPAHFASRPSSYTLSTLAHEMAHLWQHHRGTRSRAGYHNKEWAEKMREIGLIPSDTGEPGGKDTGQKVSHYIQPGGRFERACAAFLASNAAVLYHDRAGDRSEPSRKKKAASKTRYTCPGCGLNAWAKPAAPLMCGECREAMEAEEPEEG